MSQNAEYKARWARENPEKRRGYRRTLRLKNPTYTREWEAANPEKAAEYRRRSAEKDRANGGKAAHDAVKHALKMGWLAKGPCATCGGSNGLRIEAHHHLGYAREHRLDVTWLCKQHHEDAHHEPD